MPVHGSGVLVSSWSLLIRGILAALRQKLHLSTCPNLPSHLYLPPFDVIKKPVAISASKGQTIATASYEDLLGMIKHLLSVVDVDADWYLKQYPDVREAIAQKKTPSAKQHFIDNGYFEGRLPYLIEVDEKWYLEKYPDVAASIRRGVEQRWLASSRQCFALDKWSLCRLIL
jgi:hypothetical protein